MKTKDFFYNLPEELIAQTPCDSRDHSRMMVVNRVSEKLEYKYFFEITDFLKKGDTLVINNSKVIPAKLTGIKPTGAKIELLLLQKKEPDDAVWEVLLRPAKRIRTGMKIYFSDYFWAEIRERISDKKWLLQFCPPSEFESLLEQHGKAPLPPYIKRKKGLEDYPYDRSRYQTVYALNPGSVAAPTAGLHFSEDILNRLQKQGIIIAPLTLHVGYGTFLSIETDTIEDHVMEKEYFEISAESAEKINEARRIVAVGTTSVRVLESVADENGYIRPGNGHTDLYIYPGYRFKRVNAMLTNFHLPQSSLFLLVCSFGGTELMRSAYEKAILERFRFYSYGDCMLID